MQDRWLIKWLKTPLLSTIYYGQVLSCAPIWHCCSLPCLSCDSFAFAHIPNPLSSECNKIVLKQQAHYWIKNTLIWQNSQCHNDDDHEWKWSPLDKSYLPFTQHRSSETQAWSMSWPEPGSCDKVIIRCWSELECWDRGRVLHHLSADSGVRTAPAAACSNPAVPSSSSRDKWTVLSSRDVLILWYRAHTTFCSINNALPTSCLFAPSKVIM